ncbi:hypothetical protein K5D27_00165 [Acinetobacter baumannii]|uniref:Uncharacterized protein n=1 Tax=Acinetobacter baumannii (strain 1295743) TaxID=1310613 RepID=A0A009IPA9_ACIB9|nr:hypothetical protein [Acinetobacter baumannii]EXB05628.1 hypothetical protein J512_2066 [Acinetobacter baumannii 1295743]EXB92844.1 hypothetical protein J510_0557 [Acinetobacter baumannii 466760]MCJ8825579.1 hypothetical protein [Acinetobacter baumannii]MCJ8838415.1 hypothetical protein [Acinetobacter baumannii]MCJ9332447.1 hypothetical protein [Acinetobacter baumannii]
MKHDIAEANPLELYFTPLRSNASQAANIKAIWFCRYWGVTPRNKA